MPPARMMYELAQAIPANAIVVDDAISSRGALRHYFKATKRGDIRGARGQAIGAGIGMTMGTQCANPDRPVFGIIGDGSAMMTIQGLWTAANDHIPCIFVICNNGMYRVLKVNFEVYQREILQTSTLTGARLPYSVFPRPSMWPRSPTVWGCTGSASSIRTPSSPPSTGQWPRASRLCSTSSLTGRCRVARHGL